MANNKVSSLLNVDIPTPKRSNFNLVRAKTQAVERMHFQQTFQLTDD